MPHKGTLTHLLDLQQEISYAFAKQQYLVSVFFDIEKAYVMAWRYGIIKRLINSGIRGRLTHFASNFLKERFIQVRVNNTLSSSYPLQNGVPQGSVISVYCFLLLMNDVVHSIPPPIQPRLFADDLQISMTTHNILLAQNLLQICLDNLITWSNTTDLKFSISKTKCVIFTRKHRQPHLILHLNGILPICSEASFLGCHLRQ